MNQPYQSYGPDDHDGPSAHPAPPAEWWQRLVARLVDTVGFALVHSVIASLCWGMFGPSFGVGEDGFRFSGSIVVPVVLAGLISGLLYAGYDAFMHLRFGATAGKLALGLRLHRADGQPLDQATILKRAAIYPGVFALAGPLVALDWSLDWFSLDTGWWWLTLLTAVDGLFLLLDHDRRRCLHDRLADTVVLATHDSPLGRTS